MGFLLSQTAMIFGLFFPTPGIPGIWSEESPISAFSSMIWGGVDIFQNLCRGILIVVLPFEVFEGGSLPCPLQAEADPSPG